MTTTISNCAHETDPADELVELAALGLVESEEDKQRLVGRVMRCPACAARLRDYATLAELMPALGDLVIARPEAAGLANELETLRARFGHLFPEFDPDEVEDESDGEDGEWQAPTHTRSPSPTHRGHPRLSALGSLAAALIVVLLAGLIYTMRSGKSGPLPSGQATRTKPALTAPEINLIAVSMDSATDGWAVGLTTDASGHQLSGFMHYSGGKWTLTADTGGDFLTSISMVSATDGWAVGSNAIYHYDGHTWLLWPDHVNYSLNVVRMLSATDGWALGHEDVGRGQPGVNMRAIQHFDGTAWVPQPLPAIPNVTASYSVDIYGLSMVSPTEGWAVGTAQANIPSVTTQPDKNTPIPIDVGFILHYTGGQWTLAYEQPHQVLTNITMGSATDGWAYGHAESWTSTIHGPQALETPLLLHLSREQWQEVAPPFVGSGMYNANIALDSVSPTDTWLAAGRVLAGSDGQGARVTLARFDGQRFDSQQVALPERSRVAIGALVMVSPTEGWAVGGSVVTGAAENGGPLGQPVFTALILHYHDGKWVVALD